MDEVLPLIKAFLGQMDSAMKISDILAKHANSEEIEVDHIVGGLVYRLMVPMNESEINQSLSSAQQIIDKLDDTDSEEETEDYNDQLIEFKRKIKRPICNCEICSKLRVCLINYPSYECSDPLAEKFKHAIDETCKTHKLYF